MPMKRPKWSCGRLALRIFLAVQVSIMFRLLGTHDAHASDMLPHHVSFGQQVVGTTSPPKAISITNTGTVPITIQSVSLQGAFVRSSACLGTLLPTISCSISVSFSPKALGHRVGSLAITDDAPDSPQEVVLSGTGGQPKLVRAGFDPVPGANSSDLIAVSPLSESPVGANTSGVTFQIAD